MIKKRITWTGLFDEEEKSEDFYFHLTKDDIISMELGSDLTVVFTKLRESGDTGEQYNFIKEIIGKAYGIRNGDDFDKSDPVLASRFLRSPAFDSLIMELLTSEDRMIKFILGIFPKDLSSQISQEEIGLAIEKGRIQAGIAGEDQIEEHPLPADEDQTEEHPLPADPEKKPDLESLEKMVPEDMKELLMRRIHEQ